MGETVVHAPRAHAPYFVGPATDFLLAGGASILLYAAFAASGIRAATPLIWQISYALAWLLNWPHFSATAVRLYGSQGSRESYPLTSWVLPPVLLAGAAGALAFPVEIAPFFIKMFLLWSSYHYSGQTVGLSLIYARRGGFEFDVWQARALKGFVFGTFLTGAAAGEAGLGYHNFYAVAVPSLGVPEWVPALTGLMMWICGGALLALIAMRCVAEERVAPPVILLPAAAQFVWFVCGPKILGFYEFVPMFHGVQYLLVAWVARIKERTGSVPGELARPRLLKEFARWSGANLVGGAVMFWVLPRLAAQTGLDLQLTTPIVVAAVQIHHFFVDGVIWKMRDKTVASGLLAPARLRAAEGA